MKSNGTKHGSDDPLDLILASLESAARSPLAPAARSEPAAATGAAGGYRDAPDIVFSPTAALARIDAIAASSLSRGSLARYQTYRNVLVAREHDPDAIVCTLTLFVWDLCESHNSIQ